MQTQNVDTTGILLMSFPESSLNKTKWRAASTATLQSPLSKGVPALLYSSMRFFILLSLIGPIVNVAANKDALPYQVCYPVAPPHGARRDSRVALPANIWVIAYICLDKLSA
jgi:hypothetical protein